MSAASIKIAYFVTTTTAAVSTGKKYHSVVIVRDPIRGATPAYSTINSCDDVDWTATDTNFVASTEVSGVSFPRVNG